MHTPRHWINFVFKSPTQCLQTSFVLYAMRRRCSSVVPAHARDKCTFDPPSQTLTFSKSKRFKCCRLSWWLCRGYGGGGTSWL